MPHSIEKVLVIGASGLVGGHLVRQLLTEGRTVHCLARDATRVQELADAGCEVTTGDILDPAAVATALESVQAVYICIHTLSPQAHSSSGQNFMDVETAGIQNVINGCRDVGIRRLMYVTSIGVATDARSAWVCGRAQIEQRLFATGLDVTVIRPGMIIGRGGTGFDAVARGARGRAAIVLGRGTQRFRTIAVDDMAYYLAGVLDDPRSFGHHYDVGSDDVMTIGEMIDVAAERLGRRRPVKVHLPGRLLRSAAPLIERATSMPRGAMTGLVDSLQVDMSGDPKPIRLILSRTPQTYRQAIEHALR
ncbi:SDR family oxidoreductase [Nocardioides aurantiacus]|uniref:Uncharacterized protein YbjT (DUF2867 family) n=1 Tax=Nocardioides aurantiacus TaxID=86796 RepID=A0A3N2CTQ6_9ACTN|nr:NAD(P)H-binding protein [Nocardioides aurantiacus]ROR90920.1 uncharacterized protein YbjT (DUF2867 family) [Nocardioides aurantiacus]